MANQDNEPLEQTEGGGENPEENQNVEVTDDELQDVGEETQKKVKTLQSQKQHWRTKAVDPDSGKTYKELYEEARQAGESHQQAQQSASNKKQQEEGGEQSQGASFEEIMSISRLAQNLSEDEEQELKTRASEVGMQPQKLIQTPMWKSYLEQLRSEQKRKETPEQKGRVSQSQPKKPIADMTKQERSEWFFSNPKRDNSAE